MIKLQQVTQLKLNECVAENILTVHFSMLRKSELKDILRFDVINLALVGQFAL